jgi:hypothetical protein
MMVMSPRSAHLKLEFFKGKSAVVAGIGISQKNLKGKVDT